MSAQIKTIAVGMMKIANDLRWMNSGPNSGLVKFDGRFTVVALHYARQSKSSD